MKTKTVKLTRPGSNPMRDADRRIQAAIEKLSSSETGRAVLDDLALIFHGPARQLDLDGMANMLVLLREFAMGGRRDFIPKLSARRMLKENFQSALMLAIRQAEATGFNNQTIFVAGFQEILKASEAGETIVIAEK